MMESARAAWGESATEVSERRKSKIQEEVKGLQDHSKSLRKLGKRRAQKAEELWAHHKGTANQLDIGGQTDGLQHYQGHRSQPESP